MAAKSGRRKMRPRALRRDHRASGSISGQGSRVRLFARVEEACHASLAFLDQCREPEASPGDPRTIDSGLAWALSRGFAR
jgi:hypothetical protein